MLEIYNEQVRDLLDGSRKKSGLKVRQHPKLGFYGKQIIKIDIKWVIYRLCSNKVKGNEYGKIMSTKQKHS